MKHYHFLPLKYGSELLVDAGRIDALENFNLTDEPHTIHFYEILLIDEGNGSLTQDEEVIAIQPQTMIFTAPGHIRKWSIEQSLKGYALFFDGDFMHSFFSDPLFLYRFLFFHHYGNKHILELSAEESNSVHQKMEQVEKEIHSLKADSHHLLRAFLYEVLILLHRLYVNSYSLENKTTEDPAFYSFRILLEQNYTKYIRVYEYAGLMNVSTNYLNDLARKNTGMTAGELIRQRILLEAKRLLKYSQTPISEIAEKLNFSDPSNFSRFFYQHVAQTPAQYRTA
ncbi:MAG TPA: AraC family transcriptional regulator [Flavisolibacter sp.]|nr:AraC family transcriptional regulator [Flavisolibacter sp.]